MVNPRKRERERGGRIEGDRHFHFVYSGPEWEEKEEEEEEEED